MTFDYAKLKGRTRECSKTQEEVCEAVKIAPPTYSLKLNNKAVFKQSEIYAICHLLKIRPEEIGAYFFTPKV